MAKNVVLKDADGNELSVGGKLDKTYTTSNGSNISIRYATEEGNPVVFIESDANTKNTKEIFKVGNGEIELRLLRKNNGTYEKFSRICLGRNIMHIEGSLQYDERFFNSLNNWVRPSSYYSSREVDNLIDKLKAEIIELKARVMQLEGTPVDAVYATDNNGNTNQVLAVDKNGNESQVIFEEV